MIGYVRTPLSAMKGRKHNRAPGKIVKLAYFDEAGTASLSQEPICVVAAALIDGDRQWRGLEMHIRSIANLLVPHPQRAAFEFHAKELFSGNKHNKAWGKNLRWEILRKFLVTFHQFQLPIIWAACNRAEAIKRLRGLFPIDDSQIPRMCAFMTCLIETERWMRKNVPDEVAICVGDRTDFKLAAYMSDFVHHHHNRHIIPGMSITRLDHLIEGMSFRESHKSFGVQLSDSCNFLIKRHEMAKVDSESFYEIIKPQLVAGQLHALV